VLEPPLHVAAEWLALLLCIGRSRLQNPATMTGDFRDVRQFLSATSGTTLQQATAEFIHILQIHSLIIPSFDVYSRELLTALAHRSNCITTLDGGSTGNTRNVVCTKYAHKEQYNNIILTLTYETDKFNNHKSP
jgi:hypothetical protein